MYHVVPVLQMAPLFFLQFTCLQWQQPFVHFLLHRIQIHLFKSFEQLKQIVSSASKIFPSFISRHYSVTPTFLTLDLHALLPLPTVYFSLFQLSNIFSIDISAWFQNISACYFIRCFSSISLLPSCLCYSLVDIACPCFLLNCPICYCIISLL